MMAKKDENKVENEKPQNTLNDLLFDLKDASGGLSKGLINLHTLPPIDPEPPEVNGKPFTKGIIGFRKTSKGEIRLAIACGKAQVRYLTLAKFIAMVEKLHDPKSATIIIQNFKDQDEYKSSRGQILARINAKSSAIQIIQGVTSRIVRGPDDIALFDVYYIDRTDLTAFYLAAKAQISNQDELETMIQAYDGWKGYNVPLDPLKPYDD